VIAIIDYGRGNLGSVEKAFARVGVPAAVTQDPRVVDDARAVVLPGDGAFPDAMANLKTLGGRFWASASATSCCSRAARSSARAVAWT